jgi:hypothetical protein
MPKESSDISVPASIANANVKRAGVPNLATAPSAKPKTMAGKSTGVPPTNKRGK